MEHTDEQLLSGDEALAQGAWEAGLLVAASYPGTPATEILEHLAALPGVDAQWSVNEKVAFEIAHGAAVAGARSLYASKHVGVNVAMDPLMTAAYTGITGGFVVVTADDPGMHSSQNEQDNRVLARFAKVPMLEPSSPREARLFARAAFELSEKFDIPVMIRLTTRVAHTKENTPCGPRAEASRSPFAVNPAKYVMVPGNAYRRHIDLEKRLEALAVFAETTSLTDEVLASKEIGFITAGVSHLYVREAYPEASFLKLGMVNPLPVERIRRFAAQVKELVVIEELEPLLEEHLARIGVKCRAKHPSFRVGELRPEHIPAIVRGEARTDAPASTRRPVLCPGCSHRAVFVTLRKLKVTVAGDIGCYTLGSLPPLSALHSCVCMGGGVTYLEGFVRAGVERVVGVIGDSTFVHSGVTGLISAAYNKSRGVLMILDNATTAMTGSQPNPATGVTLSGQKTKQLDLAALCRACGADTVDVINPMDTAALEDLLKKRLDENRLSVVIARFPCQIHAPTKRGIPAFTAGKCTKCHLCLQVGCPAINKTGDGLVAITAALCTGCGLCAAACPFGALAPTVAGPLTHPLDGQEKK